MFYTYAYTPTVNDTEANPHIIEMELTAGVIHQVDIVFQDGCNHEEFVQVFKGNHQLWPTNPEEKLRANATVISFREFFQLTPGRNDLKARIWTTLSADFAEIVVNVGVLPKKVIQPISFDELLEAALGK